MFQPNITIDLDNWDNYLMFPAPNYSALSLPVCATKSEVW